MRAKLATITLLLGSFVVSTLLAEALVRATSPQQVIRPLSGIYERNERFGWRRRANLDVEVNTGDRPARIVTDARGFRVNGPGEYRTPERPDYRILAVGDSFLEGLMVNGEETAAKVLEQMLNEEGGASFEVVNTGTAAWGPRHYLMQVEDEVARSDYDLGLVFLFTGNDFNPDREVRVADLGARHTFRMPRQWSWNEIVQAWLFPINDWLEVRSHLFVLLKNRFETIRARLGLTNLFFPPIHRTDLDLERNWAFGIEMSDAIARLFEEAGVPVLFVLAPADYQVHEEILVEYARGFDWDLSRMDADLPSVEMAKRFASRPHLSLIDLLPHLRARADAGADLYGRVDKHWTAEGHREVALRLLPSVKARLARAGADPRSRADAGAPSPAAP